MLRGFSGVGLHRLAEDRGIEVVAPVADAFALDLEHPNRGQNDATATCVTETGREENRDNLDRLILVACDSDGRRP